MPKLLRNLFRLYSFAWFNLMADYRSKLIGILWQPLSSLFFVLAVGFVFANIQNRDPLEHLGYVATGYTAWLFIASVVTSSSTLYKANKSKILTGANSIGETIVLAQARASILFALNHLSLITAFFIIFVISGETKIGANIMAFPLVIFIYGITSFGVLNIIPLICIRYPDIEELISSCLRIIFFATPIMWKRPYNHSFELYDFNIFHHYVTIYRFCFLSESFPVKSFVITSIFTTFLFLIGLLVNRKYAPLISKSI